MNLFLAGIHGVGKTYLASKLPIELGLVHVSASSLIKEEKASASWGTDKRVQDINANQIALANAVRRRNEAGVRLLLDGHFVLLNTEGGYAHLGPDVFQALNLIGVIVLEADATIVVDRIQARDGIARDVDRTRAFMAEERKQAQTVCTALNIPLEFLLSPTVTEFYDEVLKIYRKT